MLALRALSKGSGRARRLVLRTAAKVNLTLEVLGKRADGYHEITTVMQAVDLSDRIILDDADDLELCCGAADLPTDARNLALQAALALRQAAGVARGARIELDKRIPVAAGLGGGSANAAGVLVGLNRLWGLRWSVERLDEIAATLGSDVPFFLRGGAALGTGRGEKVAALPARSLALVLVNPRFPSSTAEMYGRLTGKPGVVMGQGIFLACNALFGTLEAVKGASPMLLLGDFTDMAPFQHHAPYQAGTGEHGNHDLRNLLASATKYTAAVYEPKQAMQTVQLAIKHATTGTPGPVTHIGTR